MSRYELLEVIGHGSFGHIRKVRRLADGAVLVRKEISYKSMNHKEKNQLVEEFRILKSLEHPNIVQYYHHEHVAEESAVHLYMEYCGGGDLAGVISACKESGEYVPENMVWSVFTQLTLALYRCHYNTDPPPVGELFNATDGASPPQPDTVILHRDIKPDNVFLDEFNSVKLGDFGLAKILDQEHFMANTYVGTPYYMSPEVLLDKPFTPQSDIWSLGCVIYELCSKHPPFQAKTHLQLSEKIRTGVYPALPAMYSQTLSKTIAACLNQNPVQRPTTSTLLRLDVMKLCRKEKQVGDAQREVQDIKDQILLERETFMNEMQNQQEERHKQLLQQVQEQFDIQLEQEVQRRMHAIMNEHLTKQPASPQRHQPTPAPPPPPFQQSWTYDSPSDDVVMTTPLTSAPRTVKGPRTIHKSPSLTQLSRTLHFEQVSKQPKQALDYDSDVCATSVASASTFSSSRFSSSSYNSHSSYDTAAVEFLEATPVAMPPPPAPLQRDRQAPHYHAVYETHKATPIVGTPMPSKRRTWDDVDDDGHGHHASPLLRRAPNYRHPHMM